MDQRVETDEGRQYVGELTEEAVKHRAVNHPYLQKLISGDLPDVKGALTDFVHQYSAYSSDFIRYLSATISQLDEERHRRALLENLTEESGRIEDDDAEVLESVGIKREWVDGVPHTELFERYLSAVGVNGEYKNSHPYSDEAIIWKKMFLSLCSSQGPARALGAIGLGTENIVKYIYRPFIEAVEKHLDVSLRDRVFFDLHAVLDDQHGETLTEIAIDYAASEENQEQIREGMLMALTMRGAFFDALEARANAMMPA